MAIAIRQPKSLWSYNPIPGGCVFHAPLWHPNCHGAVFSSIDPYHHTCTRTGGVMDGLGVTMDGNDKIYCGTNSVLLPDIFTLVAWVKTTDTANNPLVCWDTSSTVPSIQLPMNVTGNLLYLGAANFRYFQQSPINVIDGNWHMVSFFVTGSGQNDIDNCYMHADLSTQTPNAPTKTAGQGTKVDFQIGQDSLYMYNGSIGEMHLFNWLISDAEEAYLNLITKWRYS